MRAGFALGAFAFTCTLGVAGCAKEPAAPAPVPQTKSATPANADPAAIDVAAAKAAIADGAVVLDVRTQSEFDAGALPDAHLIPHDEVGARMAEVEALVGPAREKTVVLYCRSGRRSGMAAKILHGAGYTVINGGAFSDLR